MEEREREHRKVKSEYRRVEREKREREDMERERVERAQTRLSYSCDYRRTLSQSSLATFGPHMVAAAGAHFRHSGTF